MYFHICSYLESSPIVRSISQVNKQRLTQSIANQSRTSEQKLAADSTSSTGIRLTCLLLTISFIFVLCTLPISIRLLIADYLPSQKSTIHWQLTQLCLTLLMYLNHTVETRKKNLLKESLIDLILDQFCSVLSNWSSISK